MPVSRKHSPVSSVTVCFFFTIHHLGPFQNACRIEHTSRRHACHAQAELLLGSGRRERTPSASPPSLKLLPPPLFLELFFCAAAKIQSRLAGLAGMGRGSPARGGQVLPVPTCLPGNVMGRQWQNMGPLLPVWGMGQAGPSPSMCSFPWGTGGVGKGNVRHCG